MHPPACRLRPRRGAERVAQNASVLGEDVAVALGAELVQQLRRTLDVGEEEGDGAGREIGPHGGIMRQRSGDVTEHPPDSGAGPVTRRTDESEEPIGAPEATHAEHRAFVAVREGRPRASSLARRDPCGSVPFTR